MTVLNEKLYKILSNTATAFKICESNPEVVNALTLLAKLIKSGKIDLNSTGIGVGGNKTENPKPQPELTDTELSQLDIETIRSMICEELPRKYLQRIAVIRFNFSSSSVAKYSKSKMIQSISSAIENESTHEAISRLAAGSDK